VKLLGLEMDDKLSFDPHHLNLKSSLAQSVGVIGRLTNYLPRGPFLRQVAVGLCLGKLQYGLAATSTPRFSLEDPVQSVSASHQIIINKAARAMTGLKRADHVPVSRLLSLAGLQSVNRLTVTAVALEAWKAWSSHDGGLGERNPLGLAMFGPSAPERVASDSTRQTRANTAGLHRLPPPHRTSYLRRSGLVALNSSIELREATSINAAKRAAIRLAQKAPL
jgi:hypothetical protein